MSLSYRNQFLYEKDIVASFIFNFKKIQHNIQHILTKLIHVQSSGNSGKTCEIYYKVNRHQNDPIDIVLVSLLLTLKVFHNFL